jgi:hypothetical protein
LRIGERGKVEAGEPVQVRRQLTPGAAGAQMR